MTKVFGVFGASALILLIICNCNLCTATQFEEIELYNVYPQTSQSVAELSVVRLRQKRQTSTDAKNQYESVSQNATDPQKQQPTGAANVSSVVVPFQASDRQLLGVNGTGQRKDLTDAQRQPAATAVSEPIQALATPTLGATADTAKKSSQLMQKIIASSVGASAAQSTVSPDETVFDEVDVPDNDTLNAAQEHSLNVTTDHHIYYNSSIYKNTEEAESIWALIKNTTHNSMLSQSHRRAMTVELTFDFPFYGHPVRNVTVATGGFLYTGEYVHSWLAATQYIAPLMANFDTSLSNESFVRIADNGTAFTVIWEKVSLQDKQDVGKFTFSATLHKNGDIVFIYYNVPININSIHDDKHPVKVGLSDAYIIDKTIFFTRRKTIYEYHRINFSGLDISNSTIIQLKALPTCLDYKDCAACSNHKTAFDCSWCPTLNRCSTGTDRKKQEWLQRGCDRTQISDASACPPLGQQGNNAQQTNTNTNANSNSNNSGSNANTAQPTNPSGDNNNNNNNNNNSSNNSSSNNVIKSPDDSAQSYSERDSGASNPMNVDPINTETKSPQSLTHNKSKKLGLAVGFLVPLCLVLTVAVWMLYAYRNPHTKSGQLLIQYRPSQWSWRRGEARYTAATIHM